MYKDVDKYQAHMREYPVRSRNLVTPRHRLWNIWIEMRPSLFEHTNSTLALLIGRSEMSVDE